jgi:DNA-binding NtrC family response regulator
MNDASPPLLLLVEDQALILLDVEAMLNEAGFEALTASNGSTAIAEIEKDCSRFGALVTDVDLGDGPSGWDVARQARQMCPNIPVVYISGTSHGDWSAEGVPKSIMIAKPFAPVQLVTAVATLINDTTMDSSAT